VRAFIVYGPPVSLPGSAEVCVEHDGLVVEKSRLALLMPGERFFLDGAHYQVA